MQKTHSQKKWKYSLETRVMLLILWLELKNFWRGCTGKTSKQQQMAVFVKDFLGGDGFQPTIFYCDDYGGNLFWGSWEDR